MNTSSKRRISVPLAILLLGILALNSKLVSAATPCVIANGDTCPCDIETEQASYNSGETVRLSVMRLANAAPVAEFFEWKLWLKSPGLPDLALVNLGYDSSLVLPAGFDVDFAALIGPVELFTLDDVIFPSGSYEIGCRLVNPITGEEYPDADAIGFTVL